MLSKTCSKFSLDPSTLYILVLLMNESVLKYISNCAQLFSTVFGYFQDVALEVLTTKTTRSTTNTTSIIAKVATFRATQNATPATAISTMTPISWTTIECDASVTGVANDAKIAAERGAIVRPTNDFWDTKCVSNRFWVTTTTTMDRKEFWRRTCPMEHRLLHTVIPIFLI